MHCHIEIIQDEWCLLQRKCYKYYPTGDEEDEDEMEYEDVALNVSVVRETQLDFYVERILLLQHTEVIYTHTDIHTHREN